MAAKRILVVDDHPDTAESLHQLLKLIGHESRAETQAQNVVDVAREFRPDIVFLDIGLPGTDGYELARALRAEFGQRPLLVAITGHTSGEDRHKSRLAGFDAHVPKPADFRVVEAILDTLEKSEERL